MHCFSSPSGAAGLICRFCRGVEAAVLSGWVLKFGQQVEEASTSLMAQSQWQFQKGLLFISSFFFFQNCQYLEISKNRLQIKCNSKQIFMRFALKMWLKRIPHFPPCLLTNSCKNHLPQCTFTQNPLQENVFGSVCNLFEFECIDNHSNRT